MGTQKRALLISTYELGRQPFGLASPAAWLREAGASVSCLDLSRQVLDEETVRAADFIAFFVPMHTATRLAVACLPKVRALNARAHLCFYGLYATVNEDYLRRLGAETVLGGEFEQGLVEAFRRAVQAERSVATPAPSVISLDRLNFRDPDRSGLPALKHYAHLQLPDGAQRVVGSVEASRGCKHFCRHCPVVPVYDGRFRVVPREVVLADIRQQVAAGAEHITFGDPDFFNGPRHALEIVRALHGEFPALTYDVTIKIEHLLRHANLLPVLCDTRCLFVTSAVESVDDAVLARLAKHHTFADFVSVVDLFRDAGLALSPTFVAFTPWTTLRGYCELLERIEELGLVENVAPVQLAIRLLVPAGSRMLELGEMRELVEPFDEAALVYPWRHPDPRVDELCATVQETIEHATRKGLSRCAAFENVWRIARDAAGLTTRGYPEGETLVSRAAIPYLNEPWYC